MATYNDQLREYILGLFVKQDEALTFAWEDTSQKSLPAISVKPDEGRFLQLLVRILGTEKAVEIGTLGGYSGIWIARGLSPGGKLVTLEKEPYHAEIAREHFKRAGVGDQVEIRVGDAHKLLEEISGEGPVDFVFIDAEKPGYEMYFDWAIEHVRMGGVIAAHNAFRGGGVLEAKATDESTKAIRAFNRRIAAEPRVMSTIYPAGDGTLIAVKVA
jgi:predicted O-methyltransferase YrrM